MTSHARDTDGYFIVSLARIGERDQRAPKRVSRLVAAAFLGPAPFDRVQINHKNGRRTDDALENLEWVSCLENIHHSMRVLGRDFRGENSSNAKLTADQIIEIRELAAGGRSFKSLADRFHVTNVCIANAATGKTWTNVGGPLVARR